jgi:hypothetical protein
MAHKAQFQFICSSERAQCFRAMYRLLLQGQRVSQGRNQQMQVAGCFLLGLLFDSEDGGDVLLRNVGLSLNDAALQHRRRTVHSHRHENLKSSRQHAFPIVNGSVVSNLFLAMTTSESSKCWQPLSLCDTKKYCKRNLSYQF